MPAPNERKILIIDYPEGSICRALGALLSGKKWQRLQSVYEAVGLLHAEQAYLVVGHFSELAKEDGYFFNIIKSRISVSCLCFVRTAELPDFELYRLQNRRLFAAHSIDGLCRIAEELLSGEEAEIRGRAAKREDVVVSAEEIQALLDVPK